MTYITKLKKNCISFNYFLDEYMGAIMTLCFEKRGVQHFTKNIGHNRTLFQFFLPLNEIIVDFHDILKRITSGYGTFDYENHDYESTNIVKVIIIILIYSYNNFLFIFKL